MKKAFITGFLGIAFAFAMTACNGNAPATDSVENDEQNIEQTDNHCMHHCQQTCQDSVCLSKNCEGCTCPDSAACHQKPQCKKDGECCKKNAEAAEGQCCKKNAEGCKKECEHHK